MLRLRLFSAVMLASAAMGTFGAVALHPVSAYAEPKALSPAVGNPLKEASGLLKSSPRAALAKIQQAEAASGRSAYETLVINQMKVAAYNGLGDTVNAGRAAEAAIATGQLPDKDRASYRSLAAQGYLAAGNTEKFAEFAKGDSDMEALLAQAYVKQGKYAQAQQTMKQAIADAGGAAKENWLLIIAEAQRKSGDLAGANQTLESLLHSNPKPEYWKSVLMGMLNQRGLSDEAKLDIYRLVYATDSFTEAKDYREMAETALIAKAANDAKKALDKGFAKGGLGKGDQADRDKRLLAKATQQAQADLAALPGQETQATALPTGDQLADVGESYMSFGQYDKAIPALQEALKKGVAKPGEAKLHLGIAYAGAKQNEKARQAWSSVPGKDISKQLAGLWAITLR